MSSSLPAPALGFTRLLRSAGAPLHQYPAGEAGPDISRIEDGSRHLVVVHTDQDDGTRAGELGRVFFVVSPNKIHHLYMGPYMAAYPDARVFASPGLIERRPDLRCDAVLGDTPHPGWAEELDQAAISGNTFFSEIVFLHRASRTPVVADLVAHFDAQTASPFGRLLARCWGVGTEPVASPEHRFYTVDAAAAARSLQRVQNWDFEHIVLSRGGLIRGNGRAVFQSVADDLIQRVGRRPRLAKRLFDLSSRVQ